jgi:hypothetical protein
MFTDILMGILMYGVIPIVGIILILGIMQYNDQIDIKAEKRLRALEEASHQHSRKEK